MLLGYLKKYIKKYFKLFLLAVFFLSIEAFCELILPTVMSKIVDVGIQNRDLPYVLSIGGIMLLITAIGAVGAVLRNHISCRVSQGFGAELRSDLFRKIQTLTFKSIGKFSRASLVTRLTNDVTQLQNFVNGTMRMLIKAPLLCVGSIVMAVLLDPSLSLIIVFTVPVILFLIILNTHISYPLFRRAQQALDNLNGATREYLSGVRVIKAFNRADFEEERFSGCNEDLAGIQTLGMKVSSAFSPLNSLVINAGIIAVLWLGGSAVNTGETQVGKIIAFINYLTQMSNSLMSITMIFNRFVRARASAERIGEVMDAQGDSMQEEKCEKQDAASGIEFRDVCFSYSGNSENSVLEQVSFSCTPGEMLGIIGTTGSGKTTIVNLIEHFYDAAQGEVLVGGADVRTLGDRKLRSGIAVVPQMNTLFTGSILENIRWGNRKAGLDEVESAAAAAQADEFIRSMPEGYDTILGQGGVNLSGGQKQRVSIARALVKKPHILILDDCTSAVDAITEAKIRENLRNNSKDMVCIVIAQRISSVADADHILVLDGGRVAGYGAGKELLQTCPTYREIFASQFGEEAVPCRK